MWHIKLMKIELTIYFLQEQFSESSLAVPMNKCIDWEMGDCKERVTTFVSLWRPLWPKAAFFTVIERPKSSVGHLFSFAMLCYYSVVTALYSSKLSRRQIGYCWGLGVMLGLLWRHLKPKEALIIMSWWPSSIAVLTMIFLVMAYCNSTMLILFETDVIEWWVIGFSYNIFKYYF